MTWPDSWTTVVTDGDDGLNPDIEILSLQVASDSDHIYFRIATKLGLFLVTASPPLLSIRSGEFSRSQSLVAPSDTRSLEDICKALLRTCNVLLGSQ